MKEEHEYLNERLDGRFPPPPSAPQLERLVEQAQRLKLAPELKVDADFARHLERRIVARADTIRQHTASRGWWARRMHSQRSGRSLEIGRAHV